MSNQITRRTILRGGAAVAGAFALGNFRGLEAHRSEERATLVVFWLNGGPSGLFNSANSFLRSGAFGVTERNIRHLGNGLYVDRESLGALPSTARAHMASINFRHGTVRPHEHARVAVLQAGSRSQLLRLAAVMPGGPIGGMRGERGPMTPPGGGPEMGNARWSELVSRHHRLLRREIRRFGGREQDTAGDGFFVPAGSVGIIELWASFVIDGGGSAITTGQKGFFLVPAGLILEVRLLADATGSIVVDLWKETYASAPPLTPLPRAVN